MKRILIYGLFVTMLFSCEDFLEPQPEYLINDQSFYSNVNDFQTALTGVYSGLQAFHNVDYIFWLAELATDNAEIQLPNPQTWEMEFDEAGITSTNLAVNRFWSSNYLTISRCNTILNRIEDVTMDEAVKKEIQGQIKFLRAYSYFYLVRIFGDVPLVNVDFTSPEQIAAYDMGRKSTDEIYDFIIEDLTDAETLLPSTVPSNKGKVSIGAVKTLLGKVYLTQHEYSSAATKLKEVIDMQAYSLEADYSKLFSVGNDDNPESILEIEYAGGNIGEGNSFQTQFYPLVQNMVVFVGGQLAGGRCVPTLSMMEAFETNDLRKEMYGDQIPLKNGGFETSRFCKKFADYNASLTSDAGTNYTVFRYADVLLMYAEALNEAGFVADGPSFEYLNDVRTRAGLPDKTSTDPDESLRITNQDEFRDAIALERRVELAFEAHRWFDLLRTGKTQEVMDAHFASKGLAFSFENYELLMPIPSRERLINPDLEQNDGY